jgi:hypothetical protein
MRPWTQRRTTVKLGAYDLFDELGQEYLAALGRVLARADRELRRYLLGRGHAIGHRMRIGHRMGDALLSVGLPDHEAGLSASQFGGKPRFCSVSSTLSYQTPIFMISRASSATPPCARTARTAARTPSASAPLSKRLQ